MELILGARWYAVSKRDPRVVDLYGRHYSSGKSGKTRRDWLASGITAPGESMVLLTSDGCSLFVWLYQRFKGGGQAGVNCAVFRNEGSVLSSDLIREAEWLAWRRWPGARLYTYVNPRAVQSSNPGYCFKCAGWRVCGVTKGNKLLILEKLPEEVGCVG